MLNPEEEKVILDKLGRKPTTAEVAVFDALWSEHCCYKSSKRWFNLFNTSGDDVALGIGEGAGLLDVGDDWLVGIGLESHNHPSAVDPFNGAATGLGGIIRDILSQGCRPVAVLDCLRFGLPNVNRQKLLLDQVVLGISSYGNCVGIPNLGGDVEFASQFDTNPLVNAMCVGIVEKEKVIRSIAETTGDKLLLFGSKTGRDGIGGVSFASENLDESQNKETRGSVQIGDPLTEKILIDAVLLLNDKGLLNGLQDLGGGGFVCAAAEMAQRGGKGASVYLEKVPVKAENMAGWEILISESQERMLAVVDPQAIKEVTKILDTFELPWAVVGEITEDKRFLAGFNESLEVDVDIDFLISGFPIPEREVDETFQQIFENRVAYEGIEQTIDLFLSHTDLSSRLSVFQQYDQHVQGNTTIPAGFGAGGIHLPNDKYLAVAAGTNSYLVDNFQKDGSFAATLEVARKIFARGARLIGMVDSLNFGNPEYPNSYGEFVEGLKGVAEFSHEFNVPVVGGNVSLYNESKSPTTRAKILASPFVGFVGLKDSPLHMSELVSDVSLYMIGEEEGILEGSQFERHFLFDTESDLEINIEQELTLSEFLQSIDFPVYCSHIGRGGFLYALIKWLLASGIGFNGVNVKEWSNEKLYGEHNARYLVGVTKETEARFKEKCNNNQIPYFLIGTTQSDSISLGNINYNVSELRDKWESPMKEVFEI